jgi:hypothetical protein
LSSSQQANQALEDSLIKFRDTETVKTQLETHLKDKLKRITLLEDEAILLADSVSTARSDT